jgi:hypothetical protein
MQQPYKLQARASNSMHMVQPPSCLLMPVPRLPFCTAAPGHLTSPVLHPPPGAVYKDILQGAGVLDILLDTLSHLPSLCDLTMIQVSGGGRLQHTQQEQQKQQKQPGQKLNVSAWQ